MDAIRASLPYHNLTSDSCLVLWPYVCSPLRHSLIGTSAVSPKSDSVSKLVFCVFLQTPSLQVFHFFHSLQYTVISHVLTRLSDTSDCAGVRSDQSWRLRLYAHSDTQRCSQRQRVPLDLSRRICWVVIGVGIKRKERYDLSFVSSVFMKQTVTYNSVILMFLSLNWVHDNRLTISF